MQTQTTQHGRSHEGDGASMARGLGWFSLGLGIAEIGAPRALARLIGVDDDSRTRATMRVLGAREIANGVGILARPQRPGPLWTRVLGDVIDLGLLGWALQKRRSNTERIAAAIVSVVGVTALDVLASRRAQRASAEAANEPVTRSVTVNRSPEEVYAFWRNFQNAPIFMQHVDAVRVIDAQRSQWTVKTPTGKTFAWDVELVDDRPGERIAWRSIEGSLVDQRVGVSLRRAPGGRGTEVKVDMRFGAGASSALNLVAKLFAGPQMATDLLRFKQLAETGEIVNSDASVHVGPHPAQPTRDTATAVTEVAS